MTRFTPFVVALVALLLVSTTAPAQDSSAPDAPGAALEPGVPYCLLGDSLLEMELLPVEKQASAGLFGAVFDVAAGSDVKVNQYWAYLEGKSAELVLETMQPVFRIQMPKVEAHTVRLCRFAVAGSKRRARIDARGTVDYFKGGFRVPLSMVEVGEDVWDLTPEKPLKHGQYGLALSSEGPIADFTIRKPEKKKRK